jgi:hypothetical protein
LNLTRAEVLAELAGADDMDEWSGTRVLVRRGVTRFQGKKVPCIEFAPPPSTPRTTGRTQAKPATSSSPAAPIDLGEHFEEPPDEAEF